MSPTEAETLEGSAMGTPTWEVAHLFPTQGTWTEGDYFSLNGNRLVELSDGYLEVLPMPTTSHQLMVFFLCQALTTFAKPRGLGIAVLAPLRVRLWSGKVREPDVVFMLTEHRDRAHEDFWEGADLAMEVVSNDDRRRDLEIKRGEYAKAGIREYWIVDPQAGTITVLRLEGETYKLAGEFPKGTQATSTLLPGFAVDVTELFSVRG